MLQLLIRWSFISRAPGGSPARNHWFTLISSMPMRCAGSATSTRVNNSRPSLETATSCRGASRQVRHLWAIATPAQPSVRLGQPCADCHVLQKQRFNVVSSIGQLGLLPSGTTSFKICQRRFSASKHSMLQHKIPARAWKVSLPLGEAQYALIFHTTWQPHLCPMASMQCCCPTARHCAAATLPFPHIIAVSCAEQQPPWAESESLTTFSVTANLPIT